METSQGGAIRNRTSGFSGSSGFTLLEIVIVVAILGLFVGLALPRFPDMTGARIQKTARKVAMTFQLARTRAISLRRYYRVEVDVQANRVLVAYYGPEGTFIEDETVRSYDTGDTDRHLHRWEDQRRNRVDRHLSARLYGTFPHSPPGCAGSGPHGIPRSGKRPGPDPGRICGPWFQVRRTR